MKTEEMESKSRQIYQQISALITGLRNDKKWASPEFNEFLLQVEKDFLNCQRKLDAKKYFVACFGALKAGKSTLMNALAEREVSPHGAGETTLHCSIILRADEKHPEGITLYRSKTNNDDEVGNKQRVEKLFAFFQDSIDKDEIKEEFDDKFYSLSKSEYILTERQPVDLQDFQDFMIAEIRINVDDDSILKKDVALIDMPGIDGAIAGGKENYLLKYVTDNCQHLLWVQSSMSAVNELTLERVTGFSNDKPSAPIFSVYNMVKSKGEWLTPEAENKELEDTCKRIVFRFKGDASTFYINAAMAWAAYSYDNEKDNFRVNISKDDLLKNSHIMDLKERLVERVNEAKLKTIVCDALDKIDDVEKKLNEEEHGINKHLKEQQDKIQEAQNAIGDLKKNLSEKLEMIRKDIPGESIQDKSRRAGICAKMMSEYWKQETADMGLLKDLNSTRTMVVLSETGNVKKDKQREVIDNTVDSLNMDVKRHFSSFNDKLFAFAEKHLKERGGKFNLDEIGQLFSYDFRGNVIEAAKNISLPDVKQWIENENVKIYDVAGFKVSRILTVGRRDKNELEKHADMLLDWYTDYLKGRISTYFYDFAIAMDKVYEKFCRECEASLIMRVESEIKKSEDDLKKAQATAEAIEKIKEDWRKVRDNAEKLKQEIKG